MGFLNKIFGSFGPKKAKIDTGEKIDYVIGGEDKPQEHKEPEADPEAPLQKEAEQTQKAATPIAEGEPLSVEPEKKPEGTEGLSSGEAAGNTEAQKSAPAAEPQETAPQQEENHLAEKTAKPEEARPEEAPQASPEPPQEKPPIMPEQAPPATNIDELAKRMGRGDTPNIKVQEGGPIEEDPQE